MPVKITAKARKSLMEKFLLMLNGNIAVKQGRLDFEIFWKESRPLFEQIQKIPILYEGISQIELLVKLDNVLSITFKQNKVAEDFLLSERLTDVEKEAASEQFSNFIDGFPYEYLCFFKLPVQIPKGIESVKLTEEIELIKPFNSVAYKSIFDMGKNQIANALLGRKSFTISDEDVFIRVRVYGYGTGAQSNAVSIVKLFLYLGEAGTLLSKGWRLGGGVEFAIEPICAPTQNLSEAIQFDLQYDTKRYISTLQLNPLGFQDYVASGPITQKGSLLAGSYKFENYNEYFNAQFVRHCKNFVHLVSESDKADIEHIITAIEWGLDGSANSNETMGFIQICIGLEALLDDRKPQTERGVTSVLADRCAYLLGKTPTDRANLAKQFREIYDLRSKLVHGSSMKLGDNERRLSHDAGNLLKRSINRELLLGRKARL